MIPFIHTNRIFGYQFQRGGHGGPPGGVGGGRSGPPGYKGNAQFGWLVVDFFTFRCNRLHCAMLCSVPYACLFDESLQQRLVMLSKCLFVQCMLFLLFGFLLSQGRKSVAICFDLLL